MDGEVVEDEELEAEELEESESRSVAGSEAENYSKKGESQSSSWLKGVKSAVKSAVDCCKEI